jgi:enterochelin esterase-like enzyme
VQWLADLRARASMRAMSAIATGASPWLDGLGDWSWPGLSRAVAELAPAPWVPALPRLREVPAVRVPVRRIAGTRPRRRVQIARVGLVTIAAATSFTVGSAFAPHAGPAPQALTAPAAAVPIASVSPFAGVAATLAAETSGAQLSAGALATPLPSPVLLSTDAAGSSIASLSYDSQALGYRDSLLVYLPPGYKVDAAERYPVLYLLHGDGESAHSFLQLGLRGTLDHLIASHAIAPMIVVMLQGAGRTDNWRNGGGPAFESYVTEAQRLVDRVLPTIPDRGSRAIAGYSMGGFGAMNIALKNLKSFSVAESWEGYFDGLSDELVADRALLAHLPFHAFVYGGASDPVANPSEDAPWAAALRAEGADAHAAVYPGAHTFAPLEAHLSQMLTFAAKSMRS